MEGEISKSMGVNTKPAHKFEINGFWLLLDPNADDATLKLFIEITTSCRTCKHQEVDSFEMPCLKCSKMTKSGTNNWEAK